MEQPVDQLDGSSATHRHCPPTVRFLLAYSFRRRTLRRKSMKTKPRSYWLPLAVAVFVGSAFELGVLPRQAHAIIGRPLTPFSFAGVARRTTRRAVEYGAAARPYPDA
jgi:hypothetical protein